MVCIDSVVIGYKSVMCILWSELHLQQYSTTEWGFSFLLFV